MPTYPLVCVCMVLLPYQDPSIKEIITRKPKLGKLKYKKKKIQKKNVRGNGGGDWISTKIIHSETNKTFETETNAQAAATAAAAVIIQCMWILRSAVCVCVCIYVKV